MLYCTVTGDDDKTVPAAADHDYQRPAKLDLVVGFLRSYCTVQYCTVLYCTVLQVGFLRLFNFLSCCTSVFAVTLSLLFSVSEPAADLRTPVNITTVYTIWAPIDTTTMGRTLAIAITLVSHHLQ